MIIQRLLRTHIAPLFGGDKRYPRLAFIAAYRFPEAIHRHFSLEHPNYDSDERAQVFDALKDYFAICAADPARPAGMPSRIVDDAWHVFILFTQEYSDFCARAFGRYLHHAPTGPGSNTGGNDDDLRHTWRLACAREGIAPVHPARLPRLFAIDRHLALPGARYYALSETDADRMRQMLGVTALIHMAGAFAGTEIWNDTIFRQMHDMAPRYDIGISGGDGTAFADAGGFDGADGGGSCSSG